MDFNQNYDDGHITIDQVIAQNNKRISEHKKKQNNNKNDFGNTPKSSKKHSKKKSKKKTGIGILIFRLISLIIIIVCARVLLNWHKENKINNEVISSLQDDTNIERTSIDVDSIEENSEENNEDNDNNNGDEEDDNDNSNSEDRIQLVSTNFEDLLSKNGDTVGWVYIANTNINFPVVKTSNNSFYLKHNFKKEYNSAGWIFGDYRNNFDVLDQNTIVYGHNRRNGTMFSNLKKYLNTSFANRLSAKYFSFNTVNQRYVAKVYSVYKISSAKLILSNNYENDEEYERFINEAKALSVHQYDTDISTDDKTLTLCTCDDNTAYRIVIHSKLIPIDAQGNEQHDDQDSENNDENDDQQNEDRSEDQ